MPLGTTEDTGPLGIATRLPMPMGMPIRGGPVTTSTGVVSLLHSKGTPSSAGVRFFRMPNVLGALALNRVLLPMPWASRATSIFELWTAMRRSRAGLYSAWAFLNTSGELGSGIGLGLSDDERRQKLCRNMSEMLCLVFGRYPLKQALLRCLLQVASSSLNRPLDTADRPCRTKRAHSGCASTQST
jgi:hypothetical protein